MPNFIIKSFLVFFFIGLTSCATTPSKPVEGPISIQLKGTSVEIQNFIEEIMQQKYADKTRYKKLEIINADNRSITFQTECMNLKSNGAFKCTGILMLVGNTGWDGPFLTITYRTNEVAGITTVKSEYKYCATNILGKISCGLESIVNSNKNLRELEISFNKNT